MTNPPSASPTIWVSAAFVPLWSSAVVIGSLALRHGPPFAVTALRFALATGLLTALAWLFRAPWPRGMALVHAAIIGLLLQGGHYAGIYAGLAAGMPAGAAGLVVGLIPVVTAAGAAPFLGERFTRRRAIACVLGVAAVYVLMGESAPAGRG